MTPVSSERLRDAARRRLPPFLFHYIDGGAGSEATMAANRADLESLPLRQRVLRDVSRIDTGADLFGARHAFPFGLAPVGLAGMNARRGEVQAARAAHSAGIPFCLSTVSACSLEEVASRAPGVPWFQLYVMRDRAFLSDLLDRAAEAGCTVLVLTVDMPVPGIRHRDYETGLAGAPGPGGQVRRFGQALLHPRWAWDVGVRGRPHSLGNVAPLLGARSGIEDFFAWMRGNFDPTVGWDDLVWLRARWRGPLLVKGIMDPEDARQAVAAGADGIVVSNHGGRQLDGAPSTAAALPAVAHAVSGRCCVMVDGGVRSGADVVRMLALGARFVLLGRPWAWALGAGGETAVRQLIDSLGAELRVAMSLCGVGRIGEIDGSCLADRR